MIPNISSTIKMKFFTRIMVTLFLDKFKAMPLVVPILRTGAFGKDISSICFKHRNR